jgi:hypothetical protein
MIFNFKFKLKKLMVEMTDINLVNIPYTQIVDLPLKKLNNPFKCFFLIFIISNLLLCSVSTVFYFFVFSSFNYSREIMILKNYNNNIMTFSDCEITTNLNFTNYINNSFVIWKKNNECSLYVPDKLYNFNILILFLYIFISVVYNIFIFKKFKKFF